MSNFSRGAGIDITAPRITNKFYCQMVQIKTTVKCLEGAPVNVKNYRMKPAKWETGVVMDVEIHVRKDGTTSNVYRVRLDRMSALNNPVFLHVGDDAINPL